MLKTLGLLRPRLLPLRPATRARHDLVTWMHPNHTVADNFRRATDFLHGFDDNLDFKIQGVSDRQYPIMLQWERPRRIER